MKPIVTILGIFVCVYTLNGCLAYYASGTPFFEPTLTQLGMRVGITLLVSKIVLERRWAKHQ